MPQTRAEFISLNVATYSGLLQGLDIDNVQKLAEYIDGSALGGGATTLNGLSDVNITNPQTNQVLYYTGSAWVNGGVPAHSHSLSGLSDVSFGSVSNANYIKHNGTNWTNVTLITAQSDINYWGKTGNDLMWISGAAIMSHIQLVEKDTGSIPGTPPSSYGYIYVKTNGIVYFKNDNGTEYDLTAGAGSPTTLVALTDTNITTPATNQVLRFDGTYWVNGAIPTHNHSAADITTGTLAVARGGTGLASYLTNRLLYTSGTTTIANLAAIVANRAIVSDANGLPTHSTVTATELGYVSGVTSAIQTQLNGKASSSHTHALAEINQGGAINNQFMMWYTNSWTPGSITAGTNVSITPSSSGLIISASGTGGSATLAGLDDVDVEAPVNNMFLKYATLTGKWTQWLLTAGDLPSHSHNASDITAGTLPVSRGGTGLTSYLANRLLYTSGTTTVANLAAITASRVLVSDANGLPTHSTVTTTELGYVSGVTSSIQTQLNGKAATSHTHTLSNLNQSGATNNQFAMWYSASWIPATITAGTNITITPGTNGITIAATGTGGSTTLAGLSDVSITTPADNMFLKYISGTGKWTQYTLTSSDIPSHTHNASDINAGTLPIARGGTGLTTYLANRLLYSSGTTTLTNLEAITANRAIISNASGLPTHSTVTATELGYVSGVTSSIQTQLNGKAASSHTHTIASGNLTDFATTAPSNGQYLVFVGATNKWTPTTVGAGESNTASNLGTGNGIFASKVGIDLQFKSLKAGSGTQITSDSTSLTIVATTTGTLAGLSDVSLAAQSNTQYLMYNGIVWVNSTINASHIGAGTLSTARGGTGLASFNSNRLFYASSSSVIAQVASITANRALISDSSGLPTHSTVTNTELGYVSGVTSSIQTQLNGKASTTHSHAWGTITGTLSSQTDLYSALLGKANLEMRTTTSILDNVTISEIQFSNSMVALNKATDLTVTIPLNSSVPLTAGFTTRLWKYGNGNVVVSPASGVTLLSKSSMRKITTTYGVAFLTKIATDTWVLHGDISA